MRPRLVPARRPSVSTSSLNYATKWAMTLTVCPLSNVRLCVVGAIGDLIGRQVRIFLDLSGERIIGLRNPRHWIGGARVLVV